MVDPIGILKASRCKPKKETTLTFAERTFRYISIKYVQDSSPPWRILSRDFHQQLQALFASQCFLINDLMYLNLSTACSRKIIFAIPSASTRLFMLSVLCVPFVALKLVKSQLCEREKKIHEETVT